MSTLDTAHTSFDAARLELPSSAFAVVVSGPSGVGKSTICKALMAADPGVRTCVTTTTRAMRNGEVDGRDYHFATEDSFWKLLDNGEMVEWAEVHGHRYGASVDAVAEAMRGGQVMLLDIDVQGAETWKRVLGRRCVRVFVLPPSISELHKRLADRRTEEKASFDLRMKTARTELAWAPAYDYVVVNTKLDDAVEELRAILTAERRRPERQGALLESMNLESAGESDG